MKGIILAAGKASRFDGKRKYELVIDNEKLIDKHIRVLNENNIDVKVIAHIDSKIVFENNINETLYNDYFLGKNNGKSLLIGLNSIKEDESVVFMDADICYDEKILSEFIQSENESSILVGRGDEKDEEEVKIFYKNQFIKAIGKNISETIEADFLGEAVGIVKLSAKNVQVLKQHLENNDSEWEVAINELLSSEKNFKIKFDTTFSDNWLEIDNEQDYNFSIKISNNKLKLLIFSVDGYDYSKIHKYLNKMPFHKRIIENGSCGELDCDLHSNPQWCQIYAGQLPGKYDKTRGLLDNEHSKDHVRFEKLGWHLVPTENFYWNKLGKLGYKSLLVNGYGLQYMPSSCYRDMRGKLAILRDGHLAIKDINDSYHRYLKLDSDKIINSSLFPFWIDLAGKTQKNKVRETDIEILEKVLDHYKTLPILEVFENSLKAFCKGIKQLALDYRPNMINQYIGDMDNIMHYMDFDENVISESHRMFDEYIQKLFEDLQPDNIMIVSDHGMRSYQEISDYKRDVLKKNVEKFHSRSKWSDRYQRYICQGNSNLWLILADHFYKNVNMYFGKDIKKSTLTDDNCLFIQNHANILKFFDIEHESIKSMDIFI